MYRRKVLQFEHRSREFLLVAAASIAILLCRGGGDARPLKQAPAVRLGICNNRF
jgi:hypothetical protein